MTDPKRITLPGPGSQPANPAPEPPADSIATAVLGSLKAAPPSEPSPELLDATDEDAPGFNPFKFQRITVPPALRADIIRWSREGKQEPPPVDTIPPLDDVEADLDSANAEGDESDDPNSVMPVGGSRAPVLPLRSVRNFAIAVGLVLLPLAVLGVASTMRRPANDTAQTAPTMTPRTVVTTSEQAAPASPAVETVEQAPAAALPAPAAEAPLPSATTPVAPRERSNPPNAKRTAAPNAPPSRSAEPAAPAATGENALDRPFSLPK